MHTVALLPDYGDTPVDEEDLHEFVPAVLEALGDHPRKADIYDIEQVIQASVATKWITSVVSGTTHVSDLCSDHTLRELHRDLYAQVWQLAGVYRTKEYSIGIDPTAITASVRDSLTSALYRWANTDDWTPKRLAVFVHADIVRIHPFLDGNGRVSRLLSDLIYLASQGPESLLTFDWDIDKKRYIELLREYDRDHDERPFADFLRDIELPA